MTINEQITSIANDIKRQAERLALYHEMNSVFAGITLPAKCSVYFAAYSADSYYAEFSPGYQDDATKNLRPLVYAIARKFKVRFTKRHSWDKSSIEYHAAAQVRINGFDAQLSIRISGCVPNTCHVVTREIPLSDEEIEKARKAALDGVKLVRIEREIVCGKQVGQNGVPVRDAAVEVEA